MSVGTQTNFVTGSVTIQAAQNILITNLDILSSGVEYSHSLQANTKKVIIRCRGLANVQLAFIATDSATKYFTIPRGTCFELADVDLTSKTIYVQANIASQVLEIIETY